MEYYCCDTSAAVQCSALTSLIIACLPTGRLPLATVGKKYVHSTGRLKLFSVCPLQWAHASPRIPRLRLDCAWRLRMPLASRRRLRTYGYCTISAQCTVHIHTARKAGKVVPTTRYQSSMAELWCHLSSGVAIDSRIRPRPLTTGSDSLPTGPRGTTLDYHSTT